MTANAGTSAAQHERLAVIQTRLRADGRVRIEAMARHLDVSEMTIRRDLDELENLGVARRVRGGAVAVGPETFAERHSHNARAKGRIAAKVVDLLPRHGAVAFDASSTIQRVATRLDAGRDLLVMTNGLDVFHGLSDRPGVRATLTGGTPEPRTGSLVGPIATRSVHDLLFDLFVCSAAALDPILGSSEATIEEAEVKHAFATTSGRIILAVDHSKLGSRAEARGFGFDEIDLLVTDLDPDDDRLAPYRDLVELR